MKNLDLKAYGVEEMTIHEMGTVDGGGVWKLIEKALEVAGVLDVLQSFCDGFVEGVKEGYEAQQKK